MISIYSTNNSIAYQHGTRRALVDSKGCTFFQRKVNGQWSNGRHSYALDLIAKVKAALASIKENNMAATFKIESVKHYISGVFVMVLNTKTNKVNEMTFASLQEAHEYLAALNKICK